MQLFKIICLVTIFSFISCELEPNCPQQFDNTLAVQEQGHFNDAIKCVLDSKDELMNIINLAKNIAELNPIGIISDAIKVIQKGIDVITECKSLFCYGPTFKKCEKENPQGCEKWGAIVYPKCKPGYTNWLCCVCATQCPEGFRDDGLYCAKPAAYGRGAGYPIWDEQKCIDQNPDLGCEKNGLLWYPKCREGFHNVGCCICSPNCPEGWEDIGVSCKKPSSYGRGVGYAVSFGLQCLFSKENEQEQIGEERSIMNQFDECSEKRSHLLGMAQDVENRLKHQESEQAQTLTPFSITEFYYTMQEYVSIGCLQQDQQTQQEKVE